MRANSMKREVHFPLRRIFRGESVAEVSLQEMKKGLNLNRFNPFYRCSKKRSIQTLQL